MGVISDSIGKTIGAVAGPVLDIIDQTVEDKDQAERLKRRIQSEVIDQQSKSLKARVSVIKAEAESKSAIARDWRPILMLMIVAIMGNNYILAPYLDWIFDSGLMLDLPAQMWTLLKLGVGGYVAGESARKVASDWQRGKAEKERARQGIYQNAKTEDNND
ncbi:3TM-type holin [Kushneria phosphatilytica]|nr:3TM-type holin [Kushneria phosphatilytica]OHV12132.1 hypothetical protein BH688_05625 [Kushneria phosphatilytica]